MPELRDENGLVDEFENLQKSKKEIEEKIEKLKQSIIQLARQKNTNFLHGTNKICSIKEYEKVIYPEDKTKLIALIKARGLYEQFSSINYFKLSPRITKGEIDKEIIELTGKEKAYRVSLFDRKRLVVGV